jgi:hypothetical protein
MDDIMDENGASSGDSICRKNGGTMEILGWLRGGSSWIINTIHYNFSGHYSYTPCKIHRT